MDDGKKKDGRLPHPRATCNPFSALTFAWTSPLFWTGYKRDLEINDLYQPLKEHTSSSLGDKFQVLWDDEAKKKSPSLLRVMVRCYGLECAMFGMILFAMECLLRVIQPIFLGRLIAYYMPNQTTITKDQAYIYAGAVVLCSALNVFITHPYMMGILHMGMKFRVACCSLIYRKSLKLSKTALGETTVGQVVNLLSNDVNRFDTAIIFLHYLWIGPLGTIIMTYMMWQEIGESALIGVAFMLMFIPLQAWLGNRTSILRLRTALRTDERVRLMNEIISGIQVIKMYTWEDPFAALVNMARKREIKEIRATSYIRGVLISFIMFVTRVSLFASILAYVLLGEYITAEKVFVITSYYNVLRQTMTVFFPQGIAQMAEASISIKRLQKFMLYEETVKPIPDSSGSSDKKDHTNGKPLTDMKFKDLVKDDFPDDDDLKGNGTYKNLDEEESKEALDDIKRKVRDVNQTRDGGVYLNKINAKWTVAQSENTLIDLTMKIKPGSLVAVIGPVGSGKSSVLNVILKELPLSSGSVEVNGSLAYASQEPWLFVGSIRQNILFGTPMVRTRYNLVIKKCALERDFSLFPRGDKTVVGERGISLSGGQRARINLARAVYRNADIYLLDDPLSAVDAHVGRQLFEDCISNYLRGKTRILITHQLQYLNEVDHIVILKNGAIAAEGTFESLQASGLDFAELLKSDTEENQSPTKEAQGDHESDTSSREFVRHLSIHSTNSVEETINPADNDNEEEQRSKGAVGSKIYGAYASAAGSCALIFILMVLAIASQLLASGADYWTTYWVNMEENLMAVQINNNATSNNTQSVYDGLGNILINTGSFVLTRADFIYIYTGIVISLIIITLGRSFMFFWLAMRASINLHNNMFHSITRASMRFFHTNPSGRILNRFSKDMGSIDEVLPSACIDVLQIGLSLIGIITVVAIVNYWLLIPTLGVGFIFYLLRIYYLSTSRSVKRLEGVTRSPVFSHLNASLQGMTTIRAFGAQDVLSKEFDNHQDLHSSAWYLFIATSRAFGFWLDLVCVIYIGFVTLSFLVMGDENLGGNVGLAITQAMGLTGMFQWGMRQSTELENQMTSVERVIEYNDIEKEASLESTGSKKPRPSWPEKGALEMRNVWMRYAPDGNPALRSLSFILHPKDKLGIVGRTGAGKTSIISALFRLAYVEGTIDIDGVDTGEIGLHDLRSKLSIIPQEPVLFSGTMRKNLDPFDEYSDEILWEALEEVELKDAVTDLAGGLNSKMSEGGSNFSVGQRQLVCLARALIRKNRVLVLDEATANVDPQTDGLIQTTIRNKFADCTVLTIAHRLHTVMDSDKVLVMDAGTAVEFDHPHILLQNEDGVFRSMVNQTGKTMSESLIEIAKQCYENLHSKNNAKAITLEKKDT
ncbi:putative multidrug resistance-associated protein lethal(2)03659 [Arctopsyche grandis]|uniref:putative multidrug resistance-associated protein lethal(2)03659 n=1 Tax=Arctopsyche grandis TaxID=121162 RepID=UPI00406D6A45